MEQAPVIKFLLVDDHEPNLIALEGLLKRPGLELLKATNGEEALALLLDHDVGLALLDVHMPGMDGFELARLMRGTERTRHVPIIFITAGAAGPKGRFEGYGAGAVDFLQKPIEPVVLQGKANVFFEMASQRAMLRASEKRQRMLADKLSLSDRRKDEFLATLAHELRNPLAPIRSGVNLLQESADDPASRTVLEMMERQVDQMVHLVNDLMDLSRVSRGIVQLQLGPVDLRAALAQAIETARPLIGAKHQVLHTELCEDPILISGDAARLAQVFGNLLDNASKYSDAGATLTIACRTNGDQAEVIVSDTGIGLSAEQLPNVFDMFSQVDRSHARTRGGLGIGLHIVKQLVDMHEGSIEVSSAGLGQGSRFTVRLPLAKGLAHVNAGPAAGAVALARPLRILVADDNRDAVQALGLLLKSHGHGVSIAHSGPDALSEAERIAPQVIILDIGMPHMDGYETCRRIRSTPWGRDICLIALTGWGQAEDLRRAQEAGFDHHVVKPVDMERLNALLATCVPEALAG